MPVVSSPEKGDGSIFASALRILNSGGLIAYPTESFYALGVCATHEGAVKKLFALKKRPADKPLPIIVGDRDVLMSIVKKVPDQAGDLMKRYWPGPLTLIFEARDSIPPLLTGGSGKVAVRVPGPGIALDMVRMLKMPVTATSANPSGGRPAVTAGEVLEYFGDSVDLIIDSGITPGGMPSTIMDITVCPPLLLRRGRVVLD